VKFPDFPKEGIRNILCRRIFVEADKMSLLGVPVYYYHDLGLARDSGNCVMKSVDIEDQAA